MSLPLVRQGESYPLTFWLRPISLFGHFSFTRF